MIKIITKQGKQNKSSLIAIKMCHDTRNKHLEEQVKHVSKHFTALNKHIPTFFKKKMKLSLSISNAFIASFP